jgi:hypothetical protein
MGALQINLYIGNNGSEESKTKLPIESIEATREVNKIPSLSIILLDTHSKFNDEGIRLGTKIFLDASLDQAILTFSGAVAGIEFSKNSEQQKVTLLIKPDIRAMTSRVETRVHKPDPDKELSFYQYNSSNWDFLVSLADMHSRWVVPESIGDDIGVKYYFENNEGKGTYGTELDPGIFVTLAAKGEVVYVNQAEGETRVIDEVEPEDSSQPYKLFGIDSQSQLIEIVSHQTAGSLYGEIFIPGSRNDLAKEADPSLPDPIKNRVLELFNHEASFVADSVRVNQFITDEKLALARHWKAKHAFNRGFAKYSNHDFVDKGQYQKDEKGKGIVLFLGRKLHVGDALKNDVLTGQDKLGDSKFISRVTRIKHKINAEGWVTDIGWGVPKEFHTQQYPGIHAAPAFNMMPGVSGIQVGVIQEGNYDKSKLVGSLVKVRLAKQEFPVLAKVLGVRTKQDSRIFLPEIEPFIPQYFKNDVVLVSFINQSPDSTVVLGKLAMTKQESDEVKDKGI